jgi:glycerol-3-phosphate acyltransferase PlsY
MLMNMVEILLVPVAYLIGAIPFGLVAAYGTGVDIRSEGSKNIGATNVTRLLGKKRGLFTLVGDVFKGFLPIALAGILVGKHPDSGFVLALCGAAAVIGHMFPIYLGFKGGKGVATALGVFLYLSPWAIIGCLVVFVASVALSGFVSLGSLLGSAAMIVFLVLLDAPSWKIGLAVVIVLLIWIKHHQNIQRLFAGTEKSWKKK